MFVLALAAGCGGSSKTSTGGVAGAQKTSASTLVGAGSTLVAPLVARWENPPKNSGLAAAVQTTPGSIGYVAIATAVASKLHFADVENSAGAFVTPSTRTNATTGQKYAAALDFTPLPQNVVAKDKAIVKGL